QPLPGAEGLAWWQRDWTEQAAQVQADATEDLIDVLRANPAVDLLCSTQWQAASEESSAGLLGPWGEERPALQSARAALAPLRLVLLPERASVVGGEPLACTAIAVNDGDAPIALDEAQLVIASGSDSHSARELDAWPTTLPPGVTSWPVTLADTWEAELAPRLSLQVRTATASVASAARTVPFLPPPSAGATPALRVWTKDDPPTRGFVERRGWSAARLEDAPDVALLSDFEPLRAALSTADWLRLWSWVHAGGAAVVLLPGPATTELLRSLGMLRGVQTHTSLPLPVSVASAPGNFMGRVHALRE